MNKTLSKRLASLVTAFVVALTFMTVWSGAADGIPQMNFTNEMVTGLTVTKEIYRKASSDLPLRSGAEEDKKFYTENNLSEDEFRLYLLEGSSGENIAPKSGEIYTRSNKYGYYLYSSNYSNSDEGISGVDLILRPIDSSGGYEGYYYDSEGRHEVDNISVADLPTTKNFSTGTNGEFYLFDGSEGDQVYFKKIKSSYYYIIEDTALLATYNNAKFSGVYDDSVQALQNGIGLKYNSTDANLFEVQNLFDRPNDAFTIKKTVNYMAGTDIFDEEFTFELLIDDASPSGCKYEKYEGDELIETDVFPYSESPAVIKLKSNQRMEIKGIMKNTPVEVRELITNESGEKLNPSFSPLTVQSAEDGESYTLETEGLKKYISWEGSYESNKVDTADFINVPNVMMVRKKVTNPLEVEDISEYEFEFSIKNYDSGGYVDLPENKQLRYYLRDGYGAPYGDEKNNGQPFVTEDGKFTLKHLQTAIFVGLGTDIKYRIEETRALRDGKNVSVDFVMDSTSHDKTTRSETVKTAYTQSSTGEIIEVSNTYEKKLGLSVSKNVEDKYDRVDPDRDYSFRIQVYDQEEAEFLDLNSNGSVKVNGEPIANGSPVSFTLKNGETANITGLSKGTYKVVELDPNTVEEHIFVTDVQVNEGDIKTVNGNDSPTTSIGSEQFVISAVSSVKVDFTNRTIPLNYYFDIEKILFLDKNVHGDSSDAEQRFIFRVERFAENETSFTAANVIESFYVDLSCDKKMTYTADNDVKIGEDDYRYDFWHVDDTSSSTHSIFVTDTAPNVKVRKEYGIGDKYTYPCSIWNGRKTVAVTKKGKYRISEVSGWSGTDYDFWQGSNQYKGYGSGTSSDSSVIFSVSDVKADKFSSPSAVIDAVTVYRPTASFINSESEYAYYSSQSYAENTIKRK
ncbi:MAG: hypothetical protein K6G33_05440 [Ruminococcus sp.]|uniref:DUF7601 domain-containing protein n=1 Tax=Ruminococcus sp. TaxID=41978 RepID=UPI0025D4BBA1|nr:hypothetical protein [Ruminococcus sp.]MCR5600168.1 hypothetical protein [Ruminococcus sp.]